MKSIALAALITTLASTSAIAAPTAPSAPTEKSEQAALGLALLGTIAPLTLTIAATSLGKPELALVGAVGVVVLPSAGHWYAGKPTTAGMALRGTGAALLTTGAVFAIASADCEPRCSQGGVGLAIAGAALVVVGIGHDLATAGGAARAWNEAQFELGPTVVGTASGPALGFGVHGAF